MTDEASRVAMLTPLPPARTGVAHYASMLLPALRQQVDVTAFASMDGYRRDDFDRVIYQLGNNPHHEWIYREAMREPGVIVLHDLVLHHLIVEMTLARGDVDGYVAALRASHGEAGAAWAIGRANGLHSEMGNFLLPASVEVARRSHAVIVHNEWAAERLRSFGIETPIHVVPHPYDASIAPAPRRTNVPRVIGLFGFLTSAKRADVVLAAFAEARRAMPELRLLVVGEPAPDIDVAKLASDGITFTGYADDEAFAAYYAQVDRLVNLRYPTAGESSGTLIRAFQAGRAVAVSDYAQFAELPDDCVTKIPFGDHEVATLTRFFLDDLPDPTNAQRRYLESHNSIAQTVNGYRSSLTLSRHAGEGGRRPGEGTRSIVPLFPILTLINASETAITIRNDGESTLRAAAYGELAYRLIVKGFNGDTQRFDRWLALPRDLAPGEETTLELPPHTPAKTLRLYHAIESVPMPEPEAFAVAAI